MQEHLGEEEKPGETVEYTSVSVNTYLELL